MRGQDIVDVARRELQITSLHVRGRVEIRPDVPNCRGNPWGRLRARSDGEIHEQLIMTGPAGRLTGIVCKSGTSRTNRPALGPPNG